MRVNKIYIISICGVLLSGCSSSVSSPQAEERWHYVTMSAYAPSPVQQGQLQQNTARYTHHEANPIKQTAQEPLATFSLDVDTGSYANVRRFLKTGSLPGADVVRVEELVNYFPLTEATKKNILDAKVVKKILLLASTMNLLPHRGMRNTPCCGWILPPTILRVANYRLRI